MKFDKRQERNLVKLQEKQDKKVIYYDSILNTKFIDKWIGEKD